MSLTTRFHRGQQVALARDLALSAPMGTIVTIRQVGAGRGNQPRYLVAIGTWTAWVAETDLGFVQAELPLEEEHAHESHGH